MIFGRKTRHRLPQFPSGVEAVFNDFCEPLPIEAVAAVREELDKEVEKLIHSATKNQKIELRLVNALYLASKALLDQYEKYSEEEKAMIIGAIRYFVISDDPFPDTDFASGFLDDAKVMNYVLDQLGEEELIIDI